MTTISVVVETSGAHRDRTRVELEHRHLDRHGEGWENSRDAVGGESGWPGCLTAFAERIAT